MADRSALSFRPIRPKDEPFLCDLYGTTRDDVALLTDWDEAQKTAFLEMQFRAQHTYYLEQFKTASFDLILLKGKSIGRLYLDPRPDEFRIIDIALLPEYRRSGIGTLLLKEILDKGAQAGLPVRIHVEQNNPALKLYRRLGFVHLQEEGIYYLMEWQPGTPA